MIIRKLFLVLVGSFLAACSGTTVVLVPDAGGKVGQVELTTESGSTLLNKANESAQASKTKQVPTQAVKLSDDKIRDMFAGTLANEPMPPERFRFYFSMDSANLLAAANAGLAKAKAAIEARKSIDLSVIGHSDRAGDDSTDKGISMQSAETVAKALTNLGVAKHCMGILCYGEMDSANLLAAANAGLAKAKAAIEARKSCDLSVIGHSDSVGDDSTNKGIAMQYAETVAKALTNLGIAKHCIDIRYYGENDPAIPTADNVDEPRNRRVEVEIR
jgi:outer membrane protein OmpA-like peptidoglycan-associated protein